ncbi:MAG: autotransporter outer membrane beta-barrel domain-containing protein [Novosphingobium sp.]|nr:autotransporter outer membrane beta-barrel domain-containing protein [Novosphingobium sp.]
MGSAMLAAGLSASQPAGAAPISSQTIVNQQTSLSSLLLLHHANTQRMGVIGADPGTPLYPGDPGYSGQGGDGPLVVKGYNAETQTYVSESGFTYSFSNADAAAGNAFKHLNAYVGGADGLLGGEYGWEAWFKGRYSAYDGDAGTFDGSIADLFGGVGVRISPNVVIGILAGYNTTDFDTLVSDAFLSNREGGFEADGYTIGAYADVRFANGVVFNASVSYTGSRYDLTIETITGSFDADRITVAAHLHKNYAMHGWIVAPTIDFLWASEDQDAYTDSILATHPALTVEAGRISVGPKILLPAMDAGNGHHQFWVAAMGEYEFSNQSPQPISGLPDLSDVGSLRLAGGLDSKIGEGTLSLRGDIFGIGSGEYIAYGGTLGYELPF